MAIYKQKESDNWWISIYRGTGKPRIRVSSGTNDRELALEIEAQLKAAHRGNAKRDRLVSAIDELLGTDKPRSIPLEKFWDSYIALPDLDLARHTLRTRKTSINRLVKFVQEDFPLVKTVADIDRVIALEVSDRLRDEVNKGKTFNNVKGDWSTVWSAMMIRAGIQENVWKLIPNASTKDSLHGRAFDLDEEKRLLDCCRVEHEEFYGSSLIARHTGLRYKDVVHLEWSFIKDGILNTTPSKTKKHGIVVIMPVMPVVQKWLDSWKKKCEDQKYIFPLLKHRYRIQRYTSQYTDIIEKAGIEPKGAYLSFHCWRHTLETRMAAGGIPLEIRNRITGRSKASILGDSIYNHDLVSLEKALKAAL